MLFLSYAAEDSEVAGQLVELLSGQDLDVFGWRAEEQAPTLNTIEQKISQADSYLALLSPDFLADPLCRRERELAVCREQGLRVSDPTATFVHVLVVRPVEEPADGLPPRSEWTDLTGPVEDDVHEQLINHLNAAAQARRTRPGPGSVFFRNREDELEIAVRGLNNFGGPHFWLAIAPPQLGKTWFLDRLAATLVLGDSGTWEVRLIDIRDQKAETRTDLGSLLKWLFGPDTPTTQEQSTYITIASKIVASHRSRLCVIDSAELLTEDTARALRRCLSEIHNRVSETGQPQARLAVIVASRRDDEWRGVTPGPRPSILTLSKFSVRIIEDTLRELAREMGHWFDSPTFERHAVRVLKLSEGLPALLARCIAWIRDQNWAGMDQLETQGLFEELAHPYIRNSLLSSESLFPSSRNPAGSNGGSESPQSRALKHALRVLAPYRLFTQSHLLHYRDRDTHLSDAMEELGWTVQDMWRAISGSALLLRPLNEPWQEIPAAIRRLLYRYHYVTGTERAEAHNEARNFMAIWADKQQGKEQIIGLVECLWHEAVVLRLERPWEMSADLVPSARVLSRGLRESTAYTPNELREFAADRLSMDDEFRDVVDDDALVSRIIATITGPDRSEE